MITLAVIFLTTDDSFMSGWAFRGMAVPKKRAPLPAPFRFFGKEALFRFFVILRCRLIQDDENFLECRFFIGLFHGGKLASQTA